MIVFTVNCHKFDNKSKERCVNKSRALHYTSQEGFGRTLCLLQLHSFPGQPSGWTVTPSQPQAQPSTSPCTGQCVWTGHWALPAMPALVNPSFPRPVPCGGVTSQLPTPLPCRVTPLLCQPPAPRWGYTPAPSAPCPTAGLPPCSVSSVPHGGITPLLSQS